MVTTKQMGMTYSYNWLQFDKYRKIFIKLSSRETIFFNFAAE